LKTHRLTFQSYLNAVHPLTDRSTVVLRVQVVAT